MLGRIQFSLGMFTLGLGAALTAPSVSAADFDCRSESVLISQVGDIIKELETSGRVTAEQGHKLSLIHGYADRAVGVLCSHFRDKPARGRSAVPSCRSSGIALRAVPVGFKCETSKREVFERVFVAGFGDSWKAPDGTIWSDTAERFGMDDAVFRGVGIVDSSASRYCKKLGGELPSAGYFQRGEEQGIREVLPNMGHLFWTTSVNTALLGGNIVPVSIEVFDGISGKFGSWGGEQMARCILR